jgi:hypothetical protein
VCFIQPPQFLNDATRHDAKVPRITRDLHIAKLTYERVANMGDDPLHESLTLPRASLGIDNLIALAQLGIHLLNELGLILQVNIDYNAGFASAREYSCHGGSRLPETS